MTLNVNSLLNKAINDAQSAMYAGNAEMKEIVSNINSITNTIKKLKKEKEEKAAENDEVKTKLDTVNQTTEELLKPPELEFFNLFGDFQ